MPALVRQYDAAEAAITQISFGGATAAARNLVIVALAQTAGALATMPGWTLVARWDFDFKLARRRFDIWARIAPAGGLAFPVTTGAGACAMSYYVSEWSGLLLPLSPAVKVSGTGGAPSVAITPDRPGGLVIAQIQSLDSNTPTDGPVTASAPFAALANHPISTVGAWLLEYRLGVAGAQTAAAVTTKGYNVNNPADHHWYASAAVFPIPADAAFPRSYW